MCKDCAREGARQVCLSTPPVDCQEIKFLASEKSISEPRRKNCSVQDDVCHESQLRFDFQSLLCCQCDEDAFSCTRFKSVIVFSEAFKLLIKPLPDLLCGRDWCVSFSSDCCMFVIQPFALVLLFKKVTALIQWSLNTFCPGFSCCHVRMIFQSDCVILNDLFLSPPGI